MTHLLSLWSHSETPMTYKYVIVCYIYISFVFFKKYPSLVGNCPVTHWWVYFKRFFKKHSCSNTENPRQEEAALTNFGLNSSGDRRRYMVISVCVAVGTLSPLRLNWRSPSASELVLLWGLGETRLLGREYTCQGRARRGGDSQGCSIRFLSILSSTFLCSVGSYSRRPHGLQPARLLCPWDSPGKNTGVGCHFPDPGTKPRVSCIGRQVLYHRATWLSSGQTLIASPWFPGGVLLGDVAGGSQQASILVRIRWDHVPQSFNVSNRFPLCFVFRLWSVAWRTLSFPIGDRICIPFIGGMES